MGELFTRAIGDAVVRASRRNFPDMGDYQDENGFVDIAILMAFVTRARNSVQKLKKQMFSPLPKISPHICVFPLPVLHTTTERDVRRGDITDTKKPTLIIANGWKKQKKAEANNQVHMFEINNTTESIIKIKGDSTMNTELQIINQQEVLGKEFRVYGDFDNPLFLAKDVAEWIEHSNPTEMLKTIDDEEKVKIMTPSTMLRGLQANTEYNFLTEDGLYEVLMQSRKPIAKQFKSKVKEILKELRKTGSYHQPMATEDIMIYQLTELKKIKQQQLEQQLQLDTVSTRLDGMKEVISLNTTSWRDDCRKIIVRIAEKMGGHSYIVSLNSIAEHA